MTLLLIIIFTALVFEFINGFHDTANAVATVIATKVLSARHAIMLAGVTNLLGAMWGTAVAKTIASGIVKVAEVSPSVLMAALCGAIVWNLITWWYGLPSSSSHALVGGLVGATVAASGNDLDTVIWSNMDTQHWYQWSGVLWKVVVPMIISPLIGFIGAAALLGVVYQLIKRIDGKRRTMTRVFGKLQIFSAATIGFMHGTNDAQKTMGIIFLAVVTMQPQMLSSLTEIPLWIKVLCAVTIAAGTASGGWRIIRTMGERITNLRPIQGFAAETSASLLLHFASVEGIPVSTTHTITSSVLGVGAAKNIRNVHWHVASQILTAWILTLPVTAALGYVLSLIFGALL